MKRATRARRLVDKGFTMIEVMIAMLIAMIGLLGTVAVQQTVLSATANANDAAIALRLASQTLEELNARVVAPGSPAIDRMAAVATGQWSNPIHLDARGVAAAGPSGTARWARRLRVTDLGLNQPYNLSVEVSYALDSGMPKAIRMDMERRK
jgi:type IV pilus modification protein PilV